MGLVLFRSWLVNQMVSHLGVRANEMYSSFLILINFRHMQSICYRMDETFSFDNIAKIDGFISAQTLMINHLVNYNLAIDYNFQPSNHPSFSSARVADLSAV